MMKIVFVASAWAILSSSMTSVGFAKSVVLKPQNNHVTAARQAGGFALSSSNESDKDNTLRIKVFLGSTSNSNEFSEVTVHDKPWCKGQVSLIENSNAMLWTSYGWLGQHDLGYSSEFDGKLATLKIIALANSFGSYMYEADLSPTITPSVPQTSYVKVVSNDMFINSKPSVTSVQGSYPTWFSLGYHPKMITINLGFKDAGLPSHPSFYTLNQEAAAIKAVRDPLHTLGVSTVCPYVTPNGGYWSSPTSSPTKIFAHSAYYASARAVVTTARCLALDIPVSMVIGVAEGGRSTSGKFPPYPIAYLQANLGEIWWAKAAGYLVIIYVSPYQVGRSETPQFGYDPDFHENVEALVAYLKSHRDPTGRVNALPNYWQVGQYSPNVSSNSYLPDGAHESLKEIAEDLATLQDVSALPPWAVPLQTDGNLHC